MVLHSVGSGIRKFVFAEPSGRPKSIFMFSGSLVFLSIYVYFGVLGDSSSIDELFISVGFALSGIAESLRKDRRRIAGLLRITAVLVFISLLAALFSTPEIVNPR